MLICLYSTTGNLCGQNIILLVSLIKSYIARRATQLLKRQQYSIGVWFLSGLEGRGLKTRQRRGLTLRIWNLREVY